MEDKILMVVNTYSYANKNAPSGAIITKKDLPNYLAVGCVPATLYKQWIDNGVNDKEIADRISAISRRAQKELVAVAQNESKTLTGDLDSMISVCGE